MPKYLIEGSCDGSLFAETIEANSQTEVEALAIERLCEAWGETYSPDTTLDDLGDCATLREYTADDYTRDAAPALLAALRDLMGHAKETSAFDDARAGEDPGMLLAVRNAETAIAAATGEADPFTCTACGREEGECSADPCPAVIADRES